MKTKLILIVSLLTLGTQAYAKKNCTSEPKSKWMSETEFKAKIEKEGYKIRKFKQPGSCYEIYGQNPKGQKVEVYFNPVTAEVELLAVIGYKKINITAKSYFCPTYLTRDLLLLL